MLISNRHFIVLNTMLLALIFNLSACSDPKSVNRSESAVSFVQAINQNDHSKALHLVDSRLLIRNQEWESAPDGKGFVLGNSQDFYLKNESQIKAWLSENISKIGVEGAEPSKVSVQLIKDELKGVENRWQDTEMYLFLRGMADVEHIFVVGIDASGKVAAIYFN